MHEAPGVAEHAAADVCALSSAPVPVAATQSHLVWEGVHGRWLQSVCDVSKAGAHHSVLVQRDECQPDDARDRLHPVSHMLAEVTERLQPRFVVYPAAPGSAGSAVPPVGMRADAGARSSATEEAVCTSTDTVRHAVPTCVACVQNSDAEGVVVGLQLLLFGPFGAALGRVCVRVDDDSVAPYVRIPLPIAQGSAA